MLQERTPLGLFLFKATSGLSNRSEGGD